MTTESKPKLQLTPEQQKAVDSLHFDCIVTAGAGSGKTRVLVERYLHICEKHQLQPQILEQTVAITFTEKAATEMKERIRKGILSRYETDLDAENPRADAWYLLATELDRARIMTIHSFCRQILQRYPVEAGVSPDFTILEDFESRWLLKEAVEAAVNHFFQQSLSEAQWRQFERWLVGVGMKVAIQHLTSVYLELTTHGWTSGDLKQITLKHLKKVEEDLENRERRHVQLRESIFQCVDFLCSVKKKLKKVPPFRKRWSDLREQWEQLTSLPEQMAVLEALCGSEGVGGNWGKDEEIKETIRRCKESCGEYLADIQGRYYLQDEKELLNALFDVIEQIDQRYLQLKQKKNGVDFDELQWRVCQLLENNVEIRREVQQKIQYLMVDEYQDTNDLQKRMIDLITKDEQGQTTPGKRFVVGDPKQSIYRFRGANVSMFHQTLSEIAQEGGQSIELNKNFRSQPALIDFYNRLFQQLMSSKSDSPNYFTQIQSREKEADPKPDSVVHFISVPPLKELPKNMSRHEAEARMIANQIQQYVNENKGTSYKDFAILFRAMTHVKTYEREFSRWGIPFHVVKGRGFYDRQEVLDLLHLLRLLVNPDHPMSMVGVLRSPFCGLSDETLLQIAMQFQWQGSFQDWAESLTIEDVEKRKLLHFANFYAKAQEWVGTFTISELLERLLEESGYWTVLWATSRGKQSVANLKKLIRQAKGLKGFEAYSIPLYLERIDLLMEEQQIETEASVENEQSDSVKMMTIHQSKGLEFPIVVVPDLSYSNTLRIPDVKVDFSMGLVTALKDEYGNKIEFERFRLAKEREQKLEWEESVRLFYVATTRAEQVLIFSGIPDRLKKDQKVEEVRQWSKWLDGIFGYDQIDVECKRWEIGNPCLPLQVWDGFPQQVREAIVKSPSEMEKLEVKPVRDVTKVLHPLGLSPSDTLEINVTSWKSLVNCPRSYFYRHRLGLPERIEEKDLDRAFQEKTKDLPAVLRGSIVHRVIELLSQTPEKMNDWTLFLPQVWEEFKVSDSLQERAKKEITPYIRHFLESDLAQEFPNLNPENIFMEHPFSILLDGLQVTGVIDLFLQRIDGTYQIIDYKTDRATDDDQIEALAFEYKPQLQLYTLAIQQLEGILPKTASLLFLHSGKEYSFRVDERWVREAEGCLQESVKWLRTLNPTQMWEARPGTRCRSCHYSFLCEVAYNESM